MVRWLSCRFSSSFSSKTLGHSSSVFSVASMVSLTLLSAAVLATVITTAQAQSVFAHVIV